MLGCLATQTDTIVRWLHHSYGRFRQREKRPSGSIVTNTQTKTRSVSGFLVIYILRACVSGRTLTPHQASMRRALREANEPVSKATPWSTESAYLGASSILSALLHWLVWVSQSSLSAHIAQPQISSNCYCVPSIICCFYNLALARYWSVSNFSTSSYRKKELNFF